MQRFGFILISTLVLFAFTKQGAAQINVLPVVRHGPPDLVATVGVNPNQIRLGRQPGKDDDASSQLTVIVENRVTARTDRFGRTSLYGSDADVGDSGWFFPLPAFAVRIYMEGPLQLFSNLPVGCVETRWWWSPKLTPPPPYDIYCEVYAKLPVGGKFAFPFQVIAYEQLFNQTDANILGTTSSVPGSISVEVYGPAAEVVQTNNKASASLPFFR